MTELETLERRLAYSAARSDIECYCITVTGEPGCWYDTRLVLDAISRVTGRDRSEVVREVLHRWALEEIEKHTVLAGLLDAEGLAAPARGKMRES